MFCVVLVIKVDVCLGLTAFDLIMDYEEWIECGYFTDEIRARLKGTSHLPT